MRAAEWVDNGPGWLALLLTSADAVLAVRPGFVDQDVGLVGPHPTGRAVRGRDPGVLPGRRHDDEDPVTGSLNASVAQWLTAHGLLPAPYVASQGTALGRTGRVHVTADADGVWVGGGTVTCIEGTVEL